MGTRFHKPLRGSSTNKTVSHIDTGRALWTVGAATIAAVDSVAVFCLPGSLRAQEALSPYVIGTTRQLHSDVLGEDRQLIIHLPQGYKEGQQLRHTCATLLLSRGEHPKIVGEGFGHSSTTLTLDTYSHVLPDMQEQTAVRLEETLFS